MEYIIGYKPIYVLYFFGENMDNKTFKKEVYKVSIFSIVSNVVLMIFKLIAGIVANSYALISDAVHTGSDVFSTFIVMIGVRISSKDSDDNHEFGHERFESIAAIMLAVILFITGIGICYAGISKIAKGDYEILEFGWLALSVAIISIVTKEVMYQYTIRVSKKINSGALKADAWHHRSDALSSIGSLIGVVGAMLGVPILDAISSLIICLFIFKVAVDIFLDAVSKLTDEACDKQTEEQLYKLIKSVEGVINIDNLKTRKFGNKVYVQVDICADKNLNLTKSHNIAENVEIAVLTEFNIVKECFVHVNPCESIWIKNKVC